MGSENGLKEPLLQPNGSKRELDPEEEAYFDETLKRLPVTDYAKVGLFGKATLSWLNPVLVKGATKPLTKDDVPLLMKEHRATRLYQAFISNWPKHPRPNSVRGTLIKTFWKQFVTRCSLLALVRLSVLFVGPVLIQYFVQVTAGEADFPFEGYLLVFILFLAKTTEVLSSHVYQYNCQKLGLQVRSVLISSVYRKGLRLSSQARQSHGVGQIVNYMSTDAQQMSDSVVQLNNVWLVPCQVVIALCILFYATGISAVAGVVVMLGSGSATFWVAKKLETFQRRVMAGRDGRMLVTVESLSNMKIVKLQAWDNRFLNFVIDARNAEYNSLRQFMYTIAVNMLSMWFVPLLATVAIFTCTYVLGQGLDSSKAFTTIATVKIVQEPLRLFPQCLISLSQVAVSLQRLDAYLWSGELEENAVTRLPFGGDGPVISVVDGSFKWDAEQEAPTLHDINLEVTPGSLVTVVGRVGMGKSSLLSALLGEMTRTSGTVKIKGSTAYVSQQAWIQSGTIQENILFGMPMNRPKYEATLKNCALQTDLEEMESGDQTEIGERGVNLSGGQKQRIQLARAVYQDCDVYLLDDIFSAVDAHTASDLFRDCIVGALKGKTVLLVTHQIDFLFGADLIVVMKDGRIVQSGHYKDLLTVGTDFEHLVEASNEAFDKVQPHETNEAQEFGSPPVSRLSRSSSSSFQPPKSPRSPSFQLQRTSSPSRQQLERSSSNSASGLLQRSSSSARQQLERSSSNSASVPLQRSSSNSFRLQRSRSGNQGGDLEQDDVDDSFSYGSSIPAPISLLPKQASIERQYSGRKWSMSDLKKPAQEDDNPAGRLVQEEERETGRVGWSVYWLYFTRVYRGWPLVMLLLVQVVWQAFQIGGDFWVAYEADTASENGGNQGGTRNFVLVYGLLALGTGMAVTARSFLSTFIGLWTSQSFYLGMLRSLFRAPMSFFDTTPTGRILSRASTDQLAADIQVPLFFTTALGMLFQLFGVLFVTLRITWMVAVLLIPLGFAYYSYQNYYFATARELTRVDAITKAPIIHHFSETVSGFMTVRSFQRQARFVQINVDRIDSNLRMDFHNQAATEWVGLRMEMIGIFILCASCLFLVVLPSNLINQELVALCVTYGLNLNSGLFVTAWMYCQLENRMVSIERIGQYTKLPREAELTIKETQPPPSWPSEGNIVLVDLKLRYRPQTPLVLKGITLKISGGQNIGVVGRTGSGKSTLILALFRLVEAAEGRVLIDNIDISTLGLNDLRSRLSIIPQEPILFDGTVRSNLDPLSLHSDGEIWEALAKCQLAESVKELPKKLDAAVLEGGENWSLGQRQLFCLGRVLLKRSKILVLDEATASVDAETDGVMQTTIRREFKDATVVSVAHRIPTVMDSDKVLVLDAGKIKEYKSPKALMANKNSLFASLVNEYSTRSQSYTDLAGQG